MRVYLTSDAWFLDAHAIQEIDAELALGVCRSHDADAQHFTMFGIAVGYFERPWSLMGMEEALVNMAMEENDIQRVYDSILGHHIILLDIPDLRRKRFHNEFRQESRRKHAGR